MVYRVGRPSIAAIIVNIEPMKAAVQSVSLVYTSKLSMHVIADLTANNAV